METLLIYLANSSAALALFYSVYWLFLRNETFYAANRWYLFVALLTAILLPIFPVHYTVMLDRSGSVHALHSIADSFKHIPVSTNESLSLNGFSWELAFILVYITGACLFLFRLLFQSAVLVHLMLKQKIKTLQGMRIVENEKYGLPFSFFNLIFINPKFHTQDDLPEILAHEKVHIRENHWFDLLFIELLTVIFWFNPFIWFFERSIKQNHEYLADNGVLAQGHTVARYQALLVNQLMGMQIIGITNNLNFALNANRLKMMTKKKTPFRKGIKFVWALPAIALLLYAFAEPEFVNKDSNKGEATAVIPDYSAKEKLTINGKVVMEESGEALPGASILIKGTSMGTVSDIDGSFTLVDPNPKVKADGSLSTEIVVSFVGLQTVINTVSASGSAVNSIKYTVKMQDAVQILYNKSYSGEQLIPPPPPPPPADNVEPTDNPAPPPPPPAKSEVKGEIFYIVEDLPKYPGGYEALQNYVTEMQQKIAKSNGVKGKATVSFTVNGKGKATNIKVVEKDNDAASKAAVSLVSDMPDWTAGKQRGKSVPVKYLLPLEFK